MGEGGRGDEEGEGWGGGGGVLVGNLRGGAGQRLGGWGSRGGADCIVARRCHRAGEQVGASWGGGWLCWSTSAGDG